MSSGPWLAVRQPATPHGLSREPRAGRGVCWGDGISPGSLARAAEGKALLAVVHCGDLDRQDLGRLQIGVALTVHPPKSDQMPG